MEITTCETDVANGAGWLDNYNWLTDAPLADWHGVAVDADGRVTELDLSENGLAGQCPTELDGLDELSILSLREIRLDRYEATVPTVPPEDPSKRRPEPNRLTGEIPTRLGRLANLTLLGLGGNDLNGAIPPGLGNLTNLYSLDLGDNELTGETPGDRTAGLPAIYLRRWPTALSGTKCNGWESARR